MKIRVSTTTERVHDFGDASRVALRIEEEYGDSAANSVSPERYWTPEFDTHKIRTVCNVEKDGHFVLRSGYSKYALTVKAMI